jgi:hypothetical protein
MENFNGFENGFRIKNIDRNDLGTKLKMLLSSISKRSLI